MAGHGRRKSVAFDVGQQAYAVQLRLTPALLEALLRAQETGQGASMRFGATPQDNAISVGDASFRFTALAESSSCDLLHLPAAGGCSAALVGAVRQKLMVARNMQDERERVRARGDEAERRGKERKSQLLDGKPAAKGSKGPAAAAMAQRRVTPPPQQAAVAAAAAARPPRGPTPPPAQLTAGMLAGPAGRPPTHPTAAAPPAQPAAASAPAPNNNKPVHKSASTGRLGLTSKAGLAASQGAGSGASQRVLQAARAGAALRLMLIAILAERQMSLNAVKAVLADAASRVKSYKMPKKEELERTIKAVAEFRTPGVYVVYEVLKKELEQLPAEVPAAPAGGRRRSSTPPEQQGPSPSGHSGEAGAAAGAAAGVARGGAKGKKAAASGAAAAAAGRKPAAGSKRNRLDWTDDDSDGEAQPPAAQRARPQAQPGHYVKAASEPALGLAHGSAASPPSVDGGPGGSSSSGGQAGDAAGGRLTRRTSSSRGSDRADESWIQEHADRQPEPAAPIASKEEYRAREAAFSSKYEVYFALHQLIEAHKKDFEALDAAIRGASTETERERLRLELERLHQKRGQRAKRWDAAYRVLHQELSAAKSRMAEFVQRMQQQQAQVPAQQPGRGGTPPEALPAVRVK